MSRAVGTAPGESAPGGAVAGAAPNGDRLDDRYGRTVRRRGRSRLGVILLAAAIGVAAIAWAVWSGLGGTTATTLDLQTTSYRIEARSVSVTWQVSGDAEALDCVIQAQGSDHGVVGVTTARLRPTGSAVRSGTSVVKVVRPAVTGLISSCRRA
ncbi:DUF4307 domain-containing protein [uncultured Amnibacterium sp.]|uniref:DUF4307 domain-containing protein n=1 Tax=uncultured Amnibacterium sp. TaxID=1631851 RepID=UPI0035CA284C